MFGLSIKDIPAKHKNCACAKFGHYRVQKKKSPGAAGASGFRRCAKGPPKRTWNHIGINVQQPTYGVNLTGLPKYENQPLFVPKPATGVKPGQHLQLRELTTEEREARERAIKKGKTIAPNAVKAMPLKKKKK